MSLDFPTGEAEVADAILCLVAEALKEADVRPPVSRQYIAQGGADLDDRCGQLNVIVERTWLSRDGFTETQGFANCEAGDLMMDLAVTLTRCVPVAEGALAAPPSVTELQAATNEVFRAGSVIWQALEGALPGQLWERTALSREWVTSEGGSVVCATRITIDLGQSGWSCG